MAKTLDLEAFDYQSHSITEDHDTLIVTSYQSTIVFSGIRELKDVRQTLTGTYSASSGAISEKGKYAVVGFYNGSVNIYVNCDYEGTGFIYFNSDTKAC